MALVGAEDREVLGGEAIDQELAEARRFLPDPVHRLLADEETLEFRPEPDGFEADDPLARAQPGPASVHRGDIAGDGALQGELPVALDHGQERVALADPGSGRGQLDPVGRARGVPQEAVESQADATVIGQAEPGVSPGVERPGGRRRFPSMSG